MTDLDVQAVAAQRALNSRLTAISPFILGGDDRLPEAQQPPVVLAAELFERLVRAVETDPTDETIWLLLTALSAVYPSRGEVDETRRRIQLDSPMNLRMFLLDTALQTVRDIGTATIEIDVIVGGVVVDVDHSAKHDLHTGIQRVARNLLPLVERISVHHSRSLDQIPATALRTLDAVETGRILQWSRGQPHTTDEVMRTASQSQICGR